MLNLAIILEDSARRYPTKTAFTFMDTSLNYTQINSAANQVANGLKSIGIQSGDKVAINCLNIPYFPIVYFGILKTGAVVVPISVLLKREEVAYHLKDSEAKAIFAFVGTPELPMGSENYAGFQQASNCEHFFLITPKLTDLSSIEGTKTLGMLMNGQPPTFEIVETESNDTAIIVYTSGTTGHPKGAQLTHSNLMLSAVLNTNLVNLTSQDTLLTVLPLFHAFAITLLMNAGVYNGATNILLPRYDAEAALALMVKHKVTLFAGVPTMYWGLLNCKVATHQSNVVKDNLRVCVCGGASLPVKILEEFEKRFEVPILEGYGMSEGTCTVTFNHLYQKRKPGSIGTPVWGVAVKIVDENDKEVPVGEKGELVYRGYVVMKGYYNKPEATAKTLIGGWLHSGDVAVKDEEGYFYIVDRLKDMVIRGGLNVYPREVEEVMIQHEAVSLVAVIGIPDEKFGEEIKACVVLNEGQSITQEALIAYTKANIAAYKYPRIIEFMDALPTSATGKILKKELRKM